MSGEAWWTSEDNELVLPAFVAVLARLSTVEATRTAKIKSERAGGADFTYKFANIGDVLDEVRPVLAEAKFGVTQPAHSADGGKVAISTVLIHETGQWIEFAPLLMPTGNSPQAAGSAITYGRRYALLSALGMTTEDDDGAKAEDAARPRPPAQAQRSTQQAPRTQPQTSGGAQRAPGRTATAPAARTPQETAARRALFATSKEISDVVKAEFAAEFGMPLSALPVDRHYDALSFIQGRIEIHEFAGHGDTEDPTEYQTDATYGDGADDSLSSAD